MKNLIIVGNKVNPSWDPKFSPNKEKYIQAIDSMDYVCRVNRMNNYGDTGTKTDGLYIGAWKDYIYDYKGGEHVNLIPSIKDIFMVRIAWQVYFKDVYKKFITEKQKDNLIFCNFNEGRERMKYQHPCSTVSMIDYFCNTSKWCDNYNIYCTGIDVYDREHVLATGEPWANNAHKGGGAQERDYILKLIDQGKLKMLESEL